MSTAICESCPWPIDWRAPRGARLSDVKCPHCGGAVKSVVSFAIRRVHGGHTLQGKPLALGDHVQYLSEKAGIYAWLEAIIHQDTYGMFAVDPATMLRVDMLRWPPPPVAHEERAPRAAQG